jgi:DNA-binding YbaB/EbfC family protein
MNKNMMRQAQKLQAELQKVQEELENSTVEGSSGGGVIKVIMTGKQTIESITIDPETVDDIELLQDLVVAAVNDAFNKTQEMAASKMGAITGGMNIPGLGF